MPERELAGMYLLRAQLADAEADEAAALQQLQESSLAGLDFTVIMSRCVEYTKAAVATLHARDLVRVAEWAERLLPPPQVLPEDWCVRCFHPPHGHVCQHSPRPGVVLACMCSTYEPLNPDAKPQR